MKYCFKETPRKFELIQNDKSYVLEDVGEIQLDPNQLITLVNTENKRHDVVSKEWGYYITPSLNKRAKKEGYKTALVKNSFDLYYVMVVEINKIEQFNNYLIETNQILIEFLDERSMK